MKKQKQALLHVDVMNAARTEKSTIYIQLFRTFNSTGFQGSMLSFIRGRRVVADVPILWAMVPQWLFLALHLHLYTNTCNRFLVFSTHIKAGIKIIYYCLTFFQLYLSTLTSSKNILKDIFSQFWKCKILSQILFKFIINRKQVLSTIKRYCS